MKTKVNPQKCEAYGDCHAICPEIYQLDEWGYAFVADEHAEVPPELEAKAREAAKACPTEAIVIID
jgi:ferredoxin